MGALLAAAGCVPKGAPLPDELQRSIWIDPLAAEAPVEVYLVLPFDSESAAADLAPSAEIAVVKRLREHGYRVLARDEVMASLKGKQLASLKFSDEEGRALARELGADAVIRGLISDLQVNLVATDAAEGGELWRASEPFKLPIGDHSTVLSREAVVSTVKRLVRAVTDRLPQGVAQPENVPQGPTGP
ncbi:MAG: hypothetical protein KDH09_13640 [Chrysiogenetes bacterium]|nr:hypothetical protein [Chrysiogenetes bacterium]